MRTFHHKKGHEAGKTMTVLELRQALAKYPVGLPVFIEWEGVHAFVDRENFSTARTHKGDPGEEKVCLIINADSY